MQTNQKVLLSSGGMDSYLLACEPELKGATHLFVNIGQKYVGKERVAAKRVAEITGGKFVEMQTAQLGLLEHSSGIIPFRNAEMILCAAQHGTDIYFGVIADEINSDKSIEFVAAMEAVLNISHKKQYWTDGKAFRILTPFRHLSKTKLVQNYLGRAHSMEEHVFLMSNLLSTVSCYDAGDRHCGRCPSCFKRWVALTNATGLNSWKVWGFETNPYSWKTKDQWKIASLGYSKEREIEIMTALEIAERQAS